MKGDAEILEVLNELLSHELTAVNQYFIHHKMLEDWGYPRLSAKKREESIEEMTHADAVITRILFLEGVPNMQRLFPIKVGEDPIEQHQLDLALEMEALDRLKVGIKLCFDKGDAASRELLERIYRDEEGAVDWLETQLHLAEKLGTERYLAEHIGE